jgi:tetratricopeptide (TPR) repeat protein
VWPQQTQADGTTVEAELGGTRLTVKHAAPGTCFALFGVLIIGWMLTADPPEVTINNLKEGTTSTMRGGGPVTEAQAVSTGEAGSTIDTLMQEGIQFEQQGDTKKAKGKYQEALGLAGAPMNALAWLEQQNGNLDEATVLARLAVRLNPQEARYFDTLAVTLCKLGQGDEAFEVMRKAATLNPPKFGTKPDRIKEGHCE